MQKTQSNSDFLCIRAYWMPGTNDLGYANTTNTADLPTCFLLLQTPEQLSCATCLKVVSCHRLLQWYLLPDCQGATAHHSQHLPSQLSCEVPNCTVFILAG